MKTSSQAKPLALDNLSRVKHVLQKTADIGKKQDVSIAPYSETSIEQFLSFTNERQLAILNNAEFYLELLGQCYRQPDLKSTVNFYGEREEIKNIKIALNTLKFHSRVTDFSWVDDDDLVEIYDADGIQVYKNLQFYKQCSYDSLTLLCNEWHILYERSKVVTQAIFDKTAEVVGNPNGLEEYDLPVHTLKEKYLNLNKIFEVKMKFILPLFSSETGLPGAFLHTVGSKVISDCSDSSKIAHF